MRMIQSSLVYSFTRLNFMLFTCSHCFLLHMKVFLFGNILSFLSSFYYFTFLFLIIHSCRAEGTTTNIYIETALRYVFMWCHGINAAAYTSLLDYMTQRNESIHIRIDGDNDFYSQRDHLNAQHLPLTSESLRSLPRFLPSLTPHV
jgi:hypothetical protein